MVHKKMNVKLSDIATIKAGHPFRGKVEADDNGNAYTVQIRDVDAEGNILWNQLVKTDLSAQRSPVWLHKNDILFMARGIRNIAAHVDAVQHPTVCVPHFYIIQLNGNTEIIPEFLAWQLNQEIAQRYYAKSAEGSAQVSIRRAVIEETPISIPDIEKQQAIANFDKCYKQEKQILTALIENRQQQVKAISQKILTNCP